MVNNNRGDNNATISFKLALDLIVMLAISVPADKCTHNLSALRLA